jgi:hypothetical protein
MGHIAWLLVTIVLHRGMITLALEIETIDNGLPSRTSLHPRESVGHPQLATVPRWAVQVAQRGANAPCWEGTQKRHGHGRHPFEPRESSDRLVGSTAAIVGVRAQIRHLAAFDTVGSPHVPTVLLRGETGTGKGLVARVIHDSGPRAAGPFIEVNCAAIPDTLLEAELFGFAAGAFTDARGAKPGLFETASGGMLFLDEIDALPLGLQGKLLTAIESKRSDRGVAVCGAPGGRLGVPRRTTVAVALQGSGGGGRLYGHGRESGARGVGQPVAAPPAAPW